MGRERDRERECVRESVREWETDRRSEKNVVNKNKNSRFINLFSFDKMYLLQLQNKP